MSLARLVLASGLAAILLCACGITKKPLAGTAHLNRAPGNHARFDDPRTVHKQCLRKIGLGIHEFRTGGINSYPAIQVGRRPTGPTVVFYPTSAELLKIEGKAQGAVMIGAALVYPNHATSKVAQKVITCIDVGVPG